MRGRTLKCQQCGHDVDPFEALGHVARDYDDVRGAQKEHARLLEHNERLRDEERRTKSRTKNASRKDADAAVAAERKLWTDRLFRAERNLEEAGRLVEKARRIVGAESPLNRRIHRLMQQRTDEGSG